MATRGRLPGLMQRPKGRHAMMLLLHDELRAEFLSDLAASLQAVRSGSKGKASIEATY